VNNESEKTGNQMISREQIDMILRESGIDPAVVPKYEVLPDGTVYFYTKQEDRNALREQTPPVQEGISTAEGSK
jgi:hypothetical protein